MTVPGARCYICAGGPSGDHILDTGITIDFEGQLMICENCINDAAHLFGFSSQSETARMRGRIRNLEDEVTVLQLNRDTRLDRVREVLDA